MRDYHRYREGQCCGEHRLSLTHAGFESGRRTWTTNEYIVHEGLLNPRRWRQALVGFGTVFLVIVAILSAGVRDIRF